MRIGSIKCLTPPVHSHWNVKRHCNPLVKSRDSLLFIDVFPSHTSNVDVYEMITDYSGWSIKYHVDLSSVISMFPNMSLVCYPLLESLVVHCLVLGLGAGNLWEGFKIQFSI